MCDSSPPFFLLARILHFGYLVHVRLRSSSLRGTIPVPKLTPFLPPPLPYPHRTPTPTPSPHQTGGKLNILLTEDLPGLLTSKLRRRLPSSLFDSLARTYDYVVNQRNPLLQLLYLLLYLGSFATFTYEGWGRMVPMDLALSTALVGACLCSFVVACSVPAGTITQTSWQRFENYKPDGIIYESGKECVTCKVPKLARSKHCRLCGVCQSRFDHHCGWLNQCVGELNYRHFLFFLALHSLTFFWGSSCLWGVLKREMVEKKLWEATFYSPSSGMTVGATPLVVLQYMVVHEGAVCGVLALCFVMAVVLAGFLLYHLRLAWGNTTTNETFKWSAVRAHAKLARSQARRAHEASGKDGGRKGGSGRRAGRGDVEVLLSFN